MRKVIISESGSFFCELQNVGLDILDDPMGWIVTRRMLLALCFVGLLSDVSQLLSKYEKSHVVKVE